MIHKHTYIQAQAAGVTYVRWAESEQRRAQLQCAFRAACYQGACVIYDTRCTVALMTYMYAAHTDTALRGRLQRFLSSERHTAGLLDPSQGVGSGIGKGVGSSRRVLGRQRGPREALKGAAVAVQTGQTHWSGECRHLMVVCVFQLHAFCILTEEWLSLTAEELVMSRLSALGSKRMRLPLSAIHEVRAVPASQCPFSLAGPAGQLCGLSVCTFSRSYLLLLRGPLSACVQWVGAVRAARQGLCMPRVCVSDAVPTLDTPSVTSTNNSNNMTSSAVSPRISMRRKFSDRFMGRHYSNSVSSNKVDTHRAAAEGGSPERNHDSTAVTHDSSAMTHDSTAMTHDSTAMTHDSTAVTHDSTAVTHDSTAVTHDSSLTWSDPALTLHMELLLRPKGWRLGDRKILNNRAFIAVRGYLTALLTYCAHNIRHIHTKDIRNRIKNNF